MFYDECRKVTNEHMKPIRERLLHTDDKDLLAAMAEDWGFCMDAFIKVKDFFIPLKKYITRMKLKPIYDLQVEVFKNEVFLVGDMNHKVISTMVKQVEKERNGENMDRVAMTNMVMLIDQIDDPNAKGLYESKFEGPFLVDTKKFYVKLSLQLLSENSAPDYITKIHHMYLDEQDRADSYLRPSTKEKLMNTYLDECITKHATQIMDKSTGVDDMLENDRFHELKLMFDLFKLRAESLKFFQKKIFDYITDRGEKIVDEKQSEETRIINLIKFRAKLYKFLHDSFNRDYAMEGTLTKSFDEFISKSSTTTKDLNKYIDKMFHNEFKNISQDDME